MTKYIQETKLNPADKSDMKRWEGIVSNLFDNYIRLFSFYCRIHDALDKGQSDPLPDGTKAAIYKIYDSLGWASGCIAQNDNWLLDISSKAGRMLEMPDESAEVQTKEFIDEWKKKLPSMYRDREHGQPQYNTETILNLLSAEYGLYEIYYFFDQMNIPLRKFHSFDLAPAIMGIIGIPEKDIKKVRAIIDKMNENETQVFALHLHEAYLKLSELSEKQNK